MWATAQGQLPIGTQSASVGVAPIPPYALAVRLLKEDEPPPPLHEDPAAVPSPPRPQLSPLA